MYSSPLISLSLLPAPSNPSILLLFSTNKLVLFLYKQNKNFCRSRKNRFVRDALSTLGDMCSAENSAAVPIILQLGFAIFLSSLLVVSFLFSLCCTSRNGNGHFLFVCRIVIVDWIELNLILVSRFMFRLLGCHQTVTVARTSRLFWNFNFSFCGWNDLRALSFLFPEIRRVAVWAISYVLLFGGFCFFRLQLFFGTPAIPNLQSRNIAAGDSDVYRIESVRQSGLLDTIVQRFPQEAPGVQREALYAIDNCMQNGPPHMPRCVSLSFRFFLCRKFPS